MTDEELMDHLKNDTALNKVRTVLSGVIGAADQAGQQRRPQTPVEVRKQEFAGVEKILDAAVEAGLVTRV